MIPSDFTKAWFTINAAVGGGWPPSEMDHLSIEEFVDLYDVAVDQIKAENDAIRAARG